MTTTSTMTDARLLAVCVLLLAGATAGCKPRPAEDPHTPAPASASWSVTAWGALYEVFPEAGILTAGEATVVHTHVTALDGFTPLEEGRVEIVLAGAAGEEVFAAEEPARPGIFDVTLEPRSAGDFELLFRISGPAGSEEIRGGKVRVGSAGTPGQLLVAPAPKGARDGGEPVDLLKEEQWRSDFATEWVRRGRLARSVGGLARVRPPAGGEAVVTAPVDGVLYPPAAGGWPYAGRRVERGAALFRLVPRIAAERSLPALEAELAAVESELVTAEARLGRLQELLELEATSRRELEEARSKVEILTARRDAVERDLQAARSSRQGGTAGGFVLRASLAGEVASVAASPGATVAAGEALARLLRTDRLWLEVELAPGDMRTLTAAGLSAVVLDDGEGPAIRLDDVRLVSVSPELSPRTGTVSALLETGSAGLVSGATFDARLLLADASDVDAAETRSQIVVPATSLVDDGGVPVVYLQLAGESFVRQQVRIVERQGESVWVDGLVPGQRLVGRGGEAIRRSSLMASGDAHGHVH